MATVRSNEVYLAPPATVRLTCFGAAPDKRYSLAITKDARRKVQLRRNPGLRKYMFASVNKIPEQPSLIAFAFVHEGVNGSEVSCWLALRAGVLRRATSHSGTAQERRAEISAVAVCPGNRGASHERKSSMATSVRSANSPKSAGRIAPYPQESHLQLAGLARPMVHACHTGSFTSSSAG